MRGVLAKKRIRLSEGALYLLVLLLFLLWSVGRVLERGVADVSLDTEGAMEGAGLSFLFQWAGALWLVPGAVLLVRRWQKKDFYKVVLCTLALAVLVEIPYLLLGFGRGNFLFALFFSSAALYIYKMEAFGKKGAFVKLLATGAAVLWAYIMSVDGGAIFVILCALAWLTRGKALQTAVALTLLLSVASFFDPLLMLAPMGTAMLYFGKDIFPE